MPHLAITFEAPVIVALAVGSGVALILVGAVVWAGFIERDWKRFARSRGLMLRFHPKQPRGTYMLLQGTVEGCEVAIRIYDTNLEKDHPDTSPTNGVLRGLMMVEVKVLLPQEYRVMDPASRKKKLRQASKALAKMGPQDRHVGEGLTWTAEFQSRQTNRVETAMLRLVGIVQRLPA